MTAPAPIQFRAPMGTSVKVITAFAYAVFAGVAGLSWFVSRLGPIPMVAGAIGLLTVFAMAIASLGFRIRGYMLTGYELLIRFGFGSRSVSLGSITAVDPAGDVFRGSLRVFASGGLWSFLGRFHSPVIGPFQSYVSDASRVVMIAAGAERMALSPEDPVRFIEEVRRRRQPQLLKP